MLASEVQFTVIKLKTVAYVTNRTEFFFQCGSKRLSFLLEPEKG